MLHNKQPQNLVAFTYNLLLFPSQFNKSLRLFMAVGLTFSWYGFALGCDVARLGYSFWICSMCLNLWSRPEWPAITQGLFYLWYCQKLKKTKDLPNLCLRHIN